MAGKYKTKQQSAIIDCLKMNKKSYVTVVEIEKYLKDRDCSVGVTTIYRHLEKMEQEGMVARINVGKQLAACYQYIVENDSDNCFYIECEKCGQVTRMECDHLPELYSHVHADHDFSINPKKTIFYGKCGKCSR